VVNLKVEKKEGIDKPRIVHNKKLFWIIIVLGIILIVLIIFIILNGKNTNNNLNNSPLKECSIDSDCVPACGCHPNSCVPIINRSQCERVICTQECSGPLDCGAGKCGCVNNRCGII
jgi:hypothetical protein